MSITRSLESSASRAASLAWPIMRWAADLGNPRSIEPVWAHAPLEKGKEQNRPELGWPRETDSLCPKCVVEARELILSGEKDWRSLLEDTPGEIKAQIVERNGRIMMEKTCPKHGFFEDVISTDATFMKRIEGLFPGGDFETPPNPMRDHGKSTIKYGRGSVMVIDLTNRCNMMCDACFMDANQVGFVHELTLDEIKQILDNAASVKPRRQLSINFSGGEPTIHPHFLDAIRYAKEVGFFTVQASTNGIRFAQDPEFAMEAGRAGLRLAYLQFDGTDNLAHEHRRVSNLFEVKQKAIENLSAANVDVTLVPTILNGINDDQVGKIVDFAIENSDTVNVISFQPVSFTGRDEGIDDETRRARRYTLSHLAHDISEQTGFGDPYLDWFPLSAMGPFSDLVDVVLGQEAEWGSLKCGCHPNCGVGMVLFVNKKTRETIPMSKIIDLEQLTKDARQIADAARGKKWTLAQMGIALLRSYRAESSPIPFKVLLRQFLSQTGASDFAGAKDSQEYDWRILFVAGMWFQDLWNYDFRRTERCIIPYGTQMGEISFCAYNTGVGWRQIVEKLHQVATAQTWYKEVGRHEVYAGHRPVDLPAMPWEAGGQMPSSVSSGGGCGRSGDSQDEALVQLGGKRDVAAAPESP